MKRINNNLILFAGICLALGLLITEVTIGRTYHGSFFAVFAIALFTWFICGSIIHGLCKLFGGEGTYFETLGVSLQLLAVLIIVTNLLTLLWSGFAKTMQEFGILNGTLIEHPIWFDFIIHPILFTIFLTFVIKEIHEFKSLIKPLIISILSSGIWVFLATILFVGHGINPAAPGKREVVLIDLSEKIDKSKILEALKYSQIDYVTTTIDRHENYSLEEFKNNDSIRYFGNSQDGFLNAIKDLRNVDVIHLVSDKLERSCPIYLPLEEKIFCKRIVFYPTEMIKSNDSPTPTYLRKYFNSDEVKILELGDIPSNRISRKERLNNLFLVDVSGSMRNIPCSDYSISSNISQVIVFSNYVKSLSPVEFMSRKQNLCGGGGTDLNLALDYVNSKFEEVDELYILSDLFWNVSPINSVQNQFNFPKSRKVYIYMPSTNRRNQDREPPYLNNGVENNVRCNLESIVFYDDLHFSN